MSGYTYEPHWGYTKFGGFYAKWILGNKSRYVYYFTEHRDNIKNLHGYTYWVDVPDSIYTHVSVMAAAFYNDWVIRTSRMCQSTQWRILM